MPTIEIPPRGSGTRTPAVTVCPSCSFTRQRPVATVGRSRCPAFVAVGYRCVTYRSARLAPPPAASNAPDAGHLTAISKR